MLQAMSTIASSERQYPATPAEASRQSAKAAMDAALADRYTKEQNFSHPVSGDVNTEDCRAMTAPGLSEIYPNLKIPARGVKRGAPGANGGTSSAETPR